MKKNSAWQKFRYRFDNLMSKGTGSLLFLLAVITTCVVVLGGLAAVALGGADGQGTASTGKSIWFTLMHAINTGVLAKEEGSVPYLTIMTIVTLVGIFITSFLIGTISNWIKDKMMDLQRGKSRVIEKGHTVIIGFDDNIIGIIEELILANENQRDAAVVVMSDMDKIRMEEMIGDHIPDTGNVRLVCRNGRPDSLNDLQVCSLDTCKSIIVNLNNDFMTVKTILLCKSILEDNDNKGACIIATVRDPEVIAPATIAGGSRAEILNFHNTIARLMVQSGRHPGMSEILSEILSFEGNEIYVEDNPSLTGLTISQINLRLTDCVAIGMVKGDKPLINCDLKTVLEEGDKLIRIALDDDEMVLKESAQPDESLFSSDTGTVEDAHTLLIIGYSDMISQILIEENAYAVPGSRVILAAEPGNIDMDSLPDPDQLDNIYVDVRECNIYKRIILEELVAEGPSSIMLLSDNSLNYEEADARTLMLQLHLNNITEEKGRMIPLTIQMNTTGNQRLSQMLRAADYVVSSSITSKMMVQISEERHIRAILENLISGEGSAIYMKPIIRYIKIDKPVDFYTLAAAAARYDEILIGYKKYTSDGTFAIEINPADREARQFSDRDDLIVLART